MIVKNKKYSICTSEAFFYIDKTTEYINIINHISCKKVSIAFRLPDIKNFMLSTSVDRIAQITCEEKLSLSKVLKILSIVSFKVN